MYALVLLAPTVCTWGKEGKARLGKGSGAVLVAAYALVVTAYAMFGQMAREEIPGDFP